ncbi:MAG: RNA-binding transcriptional accessory protein [Bacteroidales bacterium]|nr:RNA-binding transcriptional accessory protein [Bacteroidales bacterium]
MKENYIRHIAEKLQIKTWQVENCVAMFEEGDTVPFISRYRKEKTGGLDDVEVAQIRHLSESFAELDKRKDTVLSTIEEQGALTDELRRAIEDCLVPSQLEDLYLPFRPKRRTRATVAREKGLGPLAEKMLALKTRNPETEAKQYLSEAVPSVEEALAGARDIIAEQVSEMREIRAFIRKELRRKNLCVKATKAAQDNPDAQKYRSWFNYNEDIRRMPAHRLLAILRGESEGFLSAKMIFNAEPYTRKIVQDLLHRDPKCFGSGLHQQMKLAVEDALERLVGPSISNEVIKEYKEKADIDSVKVFGDNLRQLLLEAPVGQKRTMAVDPGFRNGCKIACLDEHGNLLHHEIIYPHPPQSEKMKAIIAVSKMLETYRIEVIAVGNGTASRETEEFMRRIPMPESTKVYVVSEDGASIYSASEAAREEFPDEDVTVRGAVSIGRRLMDPLAELVKIDPKSLGVGQYQYDVDQNLLREKLDDTVVSCVNAVGVNLNTASPWLLRYVAGIGPALARNIVQYRAASGGFESREQLLEVPRLGAKAYQQCAGFLRIHGAANPLDNSAVHPESYPIVDRMAADLGVDTAGLVGHADLIAQIDPAKYVSGDVGLPTLKDILKELAKPGRDPREQVSDFAFSDAVHSIEDLEIGMELPGIVNNITDFGAFVDIGVHQDGLIHVSQFGPARKDGLKLHQHIWVTVMGVDLERRRISLRFVK